MWSYYGNKSKIIHLYPEPKYDIIIEPFAGTARYSLRFFRKKVILNDKYDVIVKIWRWLQSITMEELLSLPIPLRGQNIKGMNIPQEAKYLYGFLAGRGTERPRLTVTEWGSETFRSDLMRIAANLYRIRHWEIRQGEYYELDNIEATWFIDPPYQYGGEVYIEHNIDYEHLAEWCMTRKGQVIVCENSKATWLPFKPLVKFRGQKHDSEEVIWVNDYEKADKQLSLFELRV
ncbi:MAG: hypothetical protein QXS54_08725 [Candidatus Methanomethylicaceae archaeon]